MKKPGSGWAEAGSVCALRIGQEVEAQADVIGADELDSVLDVVEEGIDGRALSHEVTHGVQGHEASVLGDRAQPRIVEIAWVVEDISAG